MKARSDAVLGVILAGGQNRRYGGKPKALAHVAGQRIADRAVSAMRAAVDRVVLVANDAETYGLLELPMRADVQAGRGALGGIHTAVVWARDEGCRGALVAACDMPFLSGELLRRLAATGTVESAVVPESSSRRGFEPLCAFYGIGCLGAIEAALERGDRAIVSFFSEVTVHRLPRDEVSTFGDPELIFLNVNSPEERARAEAVARERARSER